MYQSSGYWLVRDESAYSLESIKPRDSLKVMNAHTGQAEDRCASAACAYRCRYEVTVCSHVCVSDWFEVLTSPALVTTQKCASKMPWPQQQVALRWDADTITQTRTTIEPLPSNRPVDTRLTNRSLAWTVGNPSCPILKMQELKCFWAKHISHENEQRINSCELPAYLLAYILQTKNPQRKQRFPKQLRRVLLHYLCW